MSLLPLPSYKKGSFGSGTSSTNPPSSSSLLSPAVVLNFIIDHPVRDDDTVDSIYGISSNSDNSNYDISNGDSGSSSSSSINGSIQLDKGIAHASTILKDSMWTNHGIHM